jgi:hypothetical protein
MTNQLTWVEELLQLRNLEYQSRHMGLSPVHRPRVARAIPDLKDNEFWDRGEVTE